MKGLELSRKFYEQHGEPMLRRDFPELFSKMAIGLFGSGSECYGYDDQISRDHDFEPGFCILVPDEVSDGELFRLERAYDKLPHEFLGVERQASIPVGGRRHGVMRTSDFFYGKTGSSDGIIPLERWLILPECSLYESVNGEVFLDNLGEVSAIRERLSYYPEDIRLKHLAGKLLLAAQAGLYNFPRLIKRGETAAAQLAVYQFVNNVLGIIFHINKTYMPYYKWQFKALENLKLFSGIGGELEFLISSGNSESEAVKKQEIIENIAKKICDELGFFGIELEQVAYLINNKISDNNIRNMHILAAE